MSGVKGQARMSYLL